MAKQRKNEVIACKHFQWKLYLREGVFWADGRSGNPIKLPRKSLDASSRTEAIQTLSKLDHVLAVKHGFAQQETEHPELSLEEGRDLYYAHAFRARSAGGVKKSSESRYRPMMENILGFLRSRSITAWNSVNNRILGDYLTHREKEIECSEWTLYGEGVFFKQVVKHLVQEQHLPDSTRLTTKLKKPKGTTRYCFRDQEVEAMLQHCLDHLRLKWMHGLLVVLAFTGVRIDEAATLSWSDVDFEESSDYGVGMLTIRANKAKSSEDRVIPMHDRVRAALMGLKRHSDGFVFYGPRGGRLKPDTVRNILRRDVIVPLSEKFPTPPGERGFLSATPHCFRHYFTSYHVRRGTPERILMKWLGHKDSRMVAHYFHLHDQESKEAMVRASRITRTDRKCG